MQDVAEQGEGGLDLRRTTISVALGGAVIALAAVAALVLLAVCVHELQYAADHPRRPGFANVIAWGAGAGTLLAAAVALLVFGLLRSRRS